MRTLSSALITELGLTLTRPGYLIQLGYSTPLRISTLGDITWNGFAWSSYDARISGLSSDGKGANSAQLMVGNTDKAIGAVVLTEGASDIAVAIWAIYAGATATADAVQVFSGVVDGADISADKVNLILMAQANRTLHSPRVFINKAAGFNYLLPAGTRINFGVDNWTLPSPVTVSKRPLQS
jgi:hypothetical protein